MAYTRKGGRGIKARSLRQEYNYYSRRAQERVAMQNALQIVRRGGVVNDYPKIFTPQTYDELFEKGITRKINGVTVRYRGEEAVKIKIQSYKQYASKSALADRYIMNYCQAMVNRGYGFDDVEEIYNLLKKLSVDRLTYLIHEPKPYGLPPVEYIYATAGQERDVVDRVKEAIELSKTGQGIERIRETLEKAKKIKKNELERLKILYGKRFI